MTPTLYVLEAGVLHIVLRIDRFEAVCVCRTFDSATFKTIVGDRAICADCLRCDHCRNKRGPLADLADQFGKMERKIVRDAPPGTFPFPIVEES